MEEQVPPQTPAPSPTLSKKPSILMLLLSLPSTSKNPKSFSNMNQTIPKSCSGKAGQLEATH